MHAPKAALFSILTVAALFAGGLLLPPHAGAAEKAESAATLERNARNALNSLYQKTSGARALRQDAVAILVFPRVTKAGFVLGGQYGKGALLRGGKAAAFYETAGVSYGLQAGAQAYGYALFFMNEGAVAQLDKADGFEIGVGPSIVIVDEGMGRNLTTTTAQSDIYAFVFSQKGLMAGLGLQGNKVTRIEVR